MNWKSMSNEETIKISSMNKKTNYKHSNSVASFCIWKCRSVRELMNSRLTLCVDISFGFLYLSNVKSFAELCTWLAAATWKNYNENS